MRRLAPGARSVLCAEVKIIEALSGGKIKIDAVEFSLALFRRLRVGRLIQHIVIIRNSRKRRRIVPLHCDVLPAGSG